MPPSTSDSSAGAALPRRRRAFAVHALAAGLAWAGIAASLSAASFSVDPTLITLSPRASSVMLSVRNQSAQPVRLQLSAFTWSQGVDGEMQVAPTEDLVFYPALFSLDPGQERKVRVGTTAAYAASERSYRLFLEELPSAERPAGAASAVQVLTRMGIPVFLAPSTSRMSGELSGVGLQGEQIAFTLENTGTLHFMPESVRVVGTSAAGEVLIDRQLQGWYVLAGGTRRFSLAVPQPDCRRVRSAAIEVRLGATTLKERLETPRGTCGP